MKAFVKDGCISCSLCVTTCPDVFRLNDENVAEAYADITPDNEDAARSAADYCPVEVIEISENP